MPCSALKHAASPRESSSPLSSFHPFQIRCRAALFGYIALCLLQRLPHPSHQPPVASATAASLGSSAAPPRRAAAVSQTASCFSPRRATVSTSTTPPPPPPLCPTAQGAVLRCAATAVTCCNTFSLMFLQCPLSNLFRYNIFRLIWSLQSAKTISGKPWRPSSPPKKGAWDAVHPQLLSPPIRPLYLPPPLSSAAIQSRVAYFTGLGLSKFPEYISTVKVSVPWRVSSFVCATWPTCCAAAGAIVERKAGDTEAAARKDNWPRIRAKRSPQEHVDAVHHHAPHEHLVSVRALTPASLAKTLNKTTSHRHCAALQCR